MNNPNRPLLVAVAIFLSALGSGQAQTTAFTYQGRLNVGGNPADGNFDMRFYLRNALTGGIPVSITNALAPVGVTNGLFTVLLDFGPGPFVGPQIWLEIAVRTNGSAIPHTVLSPRQELTPVPYARYAALAGTATAATTASGVVAGSVTAAGIASGQVVKSLNGLTDVVAITPGANVTLTTNGNSLQISATTGALTLPYNASVASGSPLFTLNNTSNGAAMRLNGNASGGFPFSVLHVDGGNANRGIYAYDVTGDAIVGDSWSGVALSGYSGNTGYGVAASSQNGTAVRGEQVASGNVGYLGIANFGVYGLGAANRYGVGADSDGATGQAIRGRHTSSGNLGVIGTATEGVYGSHNASGNWGQLASSLSGAHGDNGLSTGGHLGRVGAGPPYPAQGVGVYGYTWYVGGNSWPALFERLDNGVLVQFGVDPLAVGYAVGNISVSGGTVSYNAFTGSHYGWTEEPLERGTLVRLTGTNRWAGSEGTGEISYGIVRTTEPNDPRCLGAYLAVQTPSQPTSVTNPHLVMAVGNGDMWVTDGGNGDLEPGNYLISADVPGCAMKDDPARFPVGYICARAAEGVKWSEVASDAQGVKRKKISVLFESFERHSGPAALLAELNAQKAELRELRETLAELRKNFAQARQYSRATQSQLERTKTYATEE